MSKLDLLPHEVILKRDSSITYDPNGRRSVPNAELLLTNLALIVVVKGMLGGTKEIIRFPLEAISRDHGRARVQEGKSKSGERQLHVFFPYGVESFTLGEADVENDDPGAVLKKPVHLSGGKGAQKSSGVAQRDHLCSTRNRWDCTAHAK